ncbi:cadherin egf lag seven-pass g-type receptor 2, partial [Biomphalaria glabrata]
DNNVISFSTTTTTNSGGITITPNGDVILNKVSAAGTSETYTVVATDHGQYPGPLTCLVHGTVTITFT